MVLIVNPGGRLVALNVSVSPVSTSEKFPETFKVTDWESVLVCAGIAVDVGGSLTPVTVTVTVAVLVPP